MTTNKHIYSNGELKKDQNTVKFITSDGESVFLPIKKIENLYFHGQVRFNTRVISFLNEENIVVHTFNWNGRYSGSFLPEKQRKSGEITVRQSELYLSPERQSVAREFVRSSIHNMTRNLIYYTNRGKIDYDGDLDHIVDSLDKASCIEELMGYEADAKKVYYSYFEEILNEDFEFTERQYNPPTTKLNSLISYLNTLLYSTCTTEIHKTGLAPTIGYLHEPSERRNTLALDIADVFKPIIVDRLLFRLVNRNQITHDSFKQDTEEDYPLLKESARKTICTEYESLLEETVEHPNLERNVSYQYLIRLDAYALQNKILGDDEFSACKRWW